MKPKYSCRRRFAFGNIICGAPVFFGFTVMLCGAGLATADILRGGRTAASGGPAGAAGGGGASAPATPADTSHARANAQDALARTTNTLNAIRAMQETARAAAETGPNHLAPGLPNVPNGLGIGGLSPAAAAGVDPTAWAGAELPVQSIDTDGLINVGIRQTAQQALLDWQTFNVGRETTVHFDQSAAGANAAQWIAFNRIKDPSGNPSQILGGIKAEGQVYLINPNGVIFGGSSSVDVGTLTVTSLPVNTNLIERGLLNNPDSQFLFSGLAIPALDNGTMPAFVPDPPLAATGRYGDIIIQAGAQIETSVSADGNGGRVLLVGPNVVNRGSILTPSGQAVMAAGMQVGMAAHDAADPSLRGIDVFVGQVGAYGGSASNSGLIAAERGNITIAGRSIRNEGALTATTSVSLNGRIDLLAHYDARSNPSAAGAGLAVVPFLNRSSGSVTLGDGSLLSILPEYGAGETAIGTELALRSIINLEGRDLRFGDGSTLFAPNAIARAAAGEWYFIDGATPVSRFIQSSGTIDIGENALLNVAGSIDVEVSVAQNIITVDLRGAELANSPLQRAGGLRGASVSVDIRDAGIYQQEQWLGTPLADISGFANLIQRDVAQLTTSGGSLTLSAGQSTVVRQGAVIDVSGGSTAWQSDVVKTTQLVTGGRLVDISQATPEVNYDGVFDGSFDASNLKWSVETFYQSGLAPDGSRFERGYLEGAAGGRLVITSPAMALDGGLRGHTFSGESQRGNAPTPSGLALNFTAISRQFVTNPAFAPTPPDIHLVVDPSQEPPGPVGGPLAPSRVAAVELSTDLLKSSGFGSLTLNNPDGSLTLPSGSVFRANPFARLDFRASDLTINGALVAPGGNVTFVSPNLTLAQLNTINNSSISSTPQANPGRGNFTLGAGGLIDTSGMLVDDRLAHAASGRPAPLVMSGGSVSINAYNTVLAAGGMIDVSGGARADARGRITHGDAGSIAITGGRDLNVASVLGGSLRMDATLTGISDVAGGTLGLSAPAIQLGGHTSPDGVLHLAADFFDQGGFSNFTLSGIGLPNGTPGILVAENTEIRPIVQSRLAAVSNDGPLAFMATVVQPEGVRPAASITMAATGASSPFTSSILARGTLTLGTGSSIITDAGGSVVINGQVTTVLGSITAHGGTIRLAGAARFPSDGDPPLFSTLVVGPDSVIDASGRTVLVPDPFGMRSGRVFSGGNINLDGNILAHQGAVIVANGTSGILDLAATASSLNPATVASLAGRPTTPVRIDSVGGVITLAGNSFLHSDATLAANPGGPSANGGTLNISSSRFVPPNIISTSADINLVVTSAASVTSSYSPLAAGTRPLDANGDPVAGLGRVTTRSFEGGGFHDLTLSGNIRAEGHVSISLPGSVRLASGGVIEAGGGFSVTAGHIYAGQDFRPPALPGAIIEYFTSNVPGIGNLPLSLAPTPGTGSLSLNAGLIDLGTTSLQNIGSTSISAEGGDVRGNGILQSAGDINITAGQVYPTTSGTFSIFAYGGSSVSLGGGTPRALPFSAGGTLNIHAASIVQNGVLRAPLGRIKLGWNGAGTAAANPVAGSLAATPVTADLILGSNSVTATSAIDPLTGREVILPFGISFDSESWIDPSGLDITAIGPASKDVKLTALSLTTTAGSVIDIAGGGDMLAYRWIAGNGGTRDLLGRQDVFAIIPGYAFDYAPYSPFNPQAAALQGQAGFVNTNLRPGDQITLAQGSGVPAGTHTLLPARYALLPGAFLVTHVPGTPANPSVRADGSRVVTGYISNNLAPTRVGPAPIANFEIAPQETFFQRAEYQRISANGFFTEFAFTRGIDPPRLPIDAGLLSFTATSNVALSGAILSTRPTGARGALIDINSPVETIINATGASQLPGTLALSSGLLNSFGADSLLIGGIRNISGGQVTVTTSTNRLTLDNEDATLVGNDIILTAREVLTIADNATIRTTGNRPVGTITLGTAAAGSGNGALVRVSGTPGTSVSRTSFTAGGNTALSVGAGVTLEGGTIVLDSTSAASLSDTAALLGASVALSSGEVTLVLDNPGVLEPSSGVRLGGEALALLLSNSTSLALRSYSGLNIHGTGVVGADTFDSLAIDAAAIRGINQSGGNVTFRARSISLGNTSGTNLPADTSAIDGSLIIDAGTIHLEGGSTAIGGFEFSTLNATNAARVASTGMLASRGDLAITTPVLLGSQAARYQINADGALSVVSASSSGDVDPGFGVDLTLSGASVAIDGNISLPSGSLDVRATTGDVVIGGEAPASVALVGISRVFVDVTRHTSGGSLRLASDTGNVRILEQAVINLSAPTEGGNAGRLDVFTPGGSFEFQGGIQARSGLGGTQGVFTLDTASLPSTASLDATLDDGRFGGLREFRVRSGDVVIDGAANSGVYRLAADDGDIRVSGSINASATRGGTIDLKATGSLTLLSGAMLDASAVTFDAAGKGGRITLEAGAQRDGGIRSDARLALHGGSTIRLAVDEQTATSSAHGNFSGTLHLRAPRLASNDDLALDTIAAAIEGPSAITVEGYRLYDRSDFGTLDATLLNTVRNESAAYLSAVNYNSMLTRLAATNPSLDLILLPGVEIINRVGNLTLGTTSTTISADWNLGSHRFGPRSAPGVLTLRAAGDLVLFNAISDGFGDSPSLWLAPLLAHNPLLPANSQSWSYRFAAGADLSAASHRAVADASTMLPDQGAFLLGKNAGAATATGGANATTSSIIGNLYQVVRTGSGDIDIHTAGAIRLLNPFASIHTVGTQVADPTGVFLPGDFATPILNRSVQQVNLGSAQQNYAAQYSMAGGNVTLNAGTNIERLTRNNSGFIEDSSRQLPNNWLYRRSYVNADGAFGRIRIGTGLGAATDTAASTTWWVDFSNFFQSVGALGGGNITLTAANDIRNTDAVIPTNARASQGAPNPAKLIELGGGDLRVIAGNDISGGIYYVERGTGSLVAGGSVTTNATRSPSFGLVSNLNNPAAATLDTQTWMPTTLFMGKSSFDVQAAGGILLGPAADPFLLPQGIGNRFWYKSHFSTYSADASLTALSFGGDVTFRNAVILPGQSQALPMLRAWHETQSLFTGTSSSTAFSQPWLRLTESSINPFGPVWSLAPPSLSLTSFSGNLNVAGNITTFPSPHGQIELVAAGAISALRPVGLSNVLLTGQATRAWTSATINLSDADPRSVPAPLTPLTAVNITPQGATLSPNTGEEFMATLAGLFIESGSFTGINAALQVRQARHTRSGLHPEGADPVRIHALGGDLTGLTLFTGKSAWITSGRDLTDIAFFIQNNHGGDTSIVAAARDIIAANSSSPLRIAALAAGNALSFGESTLSGDIQISGPGGLLVMAGRDLDLGLGSSRQDGTGGGISSIGSFRNPFLPEQGAALTILAGAGPATDLASSAIAIDSFLASVAATPDGMDLVEEIRPGTDLASLSPQERSDLAIDLFFRILRDSGRDFNNPTSPDFATYRNGEVAINALFGDDPGHWEGELRARARDIRTRAGGDIRLLAPGGGLALANTSVGNPLAPPGIITESGGSIRIFTDQSVDIGIGRIFTLRGGDAIIWSSNGDIAAGSSSRTVQSAPPTRVAIDIQSASVQTDLAGLATGGGIGVLATVEGVEPGDVDLIAPSGTIDAGDAGIRVSGNINVAAVQVVNAGNIAAGGTSAGGGAAVSAPAVTSISQSPPAPTQSVTSEAVPQDRDDNSVPVMEEDDRASVFTVEVIGYGGAAPGDDDEEEEETNDRVQEPEVEEQ